MPTFDFNEPSLLCFFAVLVRYSILISLLPFTGDHRVPGPVKILLSLSLSMALYPVLLSTGVVRPADALVWGATPGGILATIACEAIFAVILGFTAKLSFDTISFGGNLVGNFMGFGIASTYDPEQQSQTQIVAEVQMIVAMLAFLVLDGHHAMLRASLGSYKIVGVGGMGGVFQNAAHSAALSKKLIELTGQVILFGIQLSAPIAIVIFGVNMAFGVMAKAMPQLNILVLSVTVSALVGLMVMFLTIPEFQGVASGITGRMSDSMEGVMRALRDGK